MTLYYDSIAGLYSLKTECGKAELLGPFVHTMLVLQEMGFTQKESREAAMQAMMSFGAAVDLESIKSLPFVVDER